MAPSSTAPRNSRRQGRAAAGGLSAAARHLRRDDGPGRPGAAALAPAAGHARRSRAERDRPAVRRRRSPSAQFRRFLPGLRGSGRRRAALAAQPRAAADRRRANGRRSRPASSSAPSCSKRCWPMPTGRHGWCARARLPAAVVAGNPEFLRPLVGVAPAGGAHLRFYAVDVGRSPDGHWWVLGDRTQAPSGAGYALENRLAMSRAHARRLSRAQGRAAGAVLPGVPGRSLGAQPPRGFARLRAHAGAAERDLFRARLSRALSRLPAGRRRGSDRARRRRLHPHRVGLEARRRAGAPARRRLRRSARAQCALAPRRARPGAGGARRHRRDRQFARLGRGRGARAAELSAGAGAGRARARSRAAECRDLVARPGARARRGRRPARRHGDRVGLPRRIARARRTARGSRRQPRGRASARKSSRRSPTAASISSPRRR